MSVVKKIFAYIWGIVYSIFHFLYVVFIYSWVKKLYVFSRSKHKYEGLFLSIVSILIMLIIIGNINGANNMQEISLLRHFSFAFNVLFIVVSALGFFFGIYLYISRVFLKIDESIKIQRIYRIVTIIYTVILVAFLFDIWVLDIISRMNTVEHLTENSDFWDTTAYFLKTFAVSFRDGIIVTLELSLLGTVIGFVLALFLVTLRLLEAGPRDNDVVKFFKKIGCGFSKLYVQIIRGTPMIVQAFVFYYLFLSIFQKFLSPNDYREFIRNVWTPLRAGLFTVSINTAAYLTEVLRGGIQSVDKGQTEGARSLGFSKIQTMLLVVFPQAIKNAFPSIGNEFIINIKDTSVLAMIGVMDLFRVGNKTILGTSGFSGKSLEVYMLIAVFYLVLTGLTSQALKYFEKEKNMPVKELTSSN